METNLLTESLRTGQNGLMPKMHTVKNADGKVHSPVQLTEFVNGGQ